MKYGSILVFLLLTTFAAGCSCVSEFERENFVDIADREDYAALNPECLYKENIRNGEITRGMNGNEVMASWGLPNVYLVSKKVPDEYWVYYVEDVSTSSILIYTLTFDNDNTLVDWDIDMKRFTDHSIVYDHKVQRDDAGSARSVSKK